MATGWTQIVDPLCGGIANVREVAAGDAPTLWELLTDPQVAATMSPPPPSVQAFQGFIDWARRQRQQGRGICFGVVPHGLKTAVGIIQVRAQEPTLFTAEWGFAIGAAFWSTGVFLDAADLVAKFAFESMGVHRLEARALTDNGRGNGALQKLGARPEGTLACSFSRAGRYSAQFLWGLSVEDWRQRRLENARFSSAHAAQKIAAAVRETQDRLRVAGGASRIQQGVPSLYPFFITGSEPK